MSSPDLRWKLYNKLYVKILTLVYGMVAPDIKHLHRMSENIHCCLPNPPNQHHLPEKIIWMEII